MRAAAPTEPGTAFAQHGLPRWNDLPASAPMGRHANTSGKRQKPCRGRAEDQARWPRAPNRTQPRVPPPLVQPQPHASQEAPNRRRPHQGGNGHKLHVGPTLSVSKTKLTTMKVYCMGLLGWRFEPGVGCHITILCQSNEEPWCSWLSRPIIVGTPEVELTSTFWRAPRFMPAQSGCLITLVTNRLHRSSYCLGKNFGYCAGLPTRVELQWDGKRRIGRLALFLSRFGSIEELCCPPRLGKASAASRQGEKGSRFIAMRVNVHTRDIRHCLIITMRERVRNQNSALTLGSLPLEPQAQIGAEFERHVEPRKAGAGVKFHPRNIMY